MTFKEYLNNFQTIIDTPQQDQAEPYTDSFYLEYTQLNWTRMNRWLKKADLNAELVKAIESIRESQTWIVIAEPWCGDAAHNVPFIQKLAELNPNITISYELRDSEPFRINDYLTNGSKSIPKLIVRDEQGKDILVWGPRPAGCQKIYTEMSAQKANHDQINIEVQKWYNANKGVELQEELLQSFKD